MKHFAGFSLLELTIVIALFALVGLFVLPHLKEVQQSNRVMSVAQDLSSAMQKAQSEALSRSSNVIVGKLGDHWKNGWLVWVETDGNSRFDRDRDTLLIENPISDSDVTIVNQLGSDHVHFGPSGFIVSMPATHSELMFEFCEGRFGQSLKFRRSAQVTAEQTSCGKGAL